MDCGVEVDIITLNPAHGPYAFCWLLEGKWAKTPIFNVGGEGRNRSIPTLLENIVWHFCR
jgi:hypothetical protein